MSKPKLVTIHRELQAAKALERRPELAKWLIEVSQLVAGDKLKHAPHAIVIALIHQDGPEIAWHGPPTFEEMREAAWAIQDQITSKQYGWPLHDSVATARANKAAEETRRAEYLVEHPWVCAVGTCTRRFKTEQGAVIHERACQRRQQRYGRA